MVLDLDLAFGVVEDVKSTFAGVDPTSVDAIESASALVLSVSVSVLVLVLVLALVLIGVLVLLVLVPVVNETHGDASMHMVWCLEVNSNSLPLQLPITHACDERLIGSREVIAFDAYLRGWLWS